MADVTLNINATINDNTIADSKLVQVPECTIKGRQCGSGSGNVENLDSDQVSIILDTATDPFVRTSNLPAPGSLPDGDYGDIVVSAGGTVMSIDSNIKSTGGNGAADSGKLLIFSPIGRISASVSTGGPGIAEAIYGFTSSVTSTHAGVRGRTSGASDTYGVYGDGGAAGNGVIGTSSFGEGVIGISTNYHGVSAQSSSATDPALHVTKTAGGKIAVFQSNHAAGDELTIEVDGGLSWNGGTGPATTIASLGLGTAALNNTGDFDAAGSAASAQAFAIQRSNHTGTQDASTITGTKTSSFISDFSTAVSTLFTTVGNAFRTLVNPSAVTFVRINADNTVTARSDSEMRTDLGLGTASIVNTGTGASNVPTITDADARYTLKSENIEYIQSFRTNTTITNIPAAVTGLVSDSEIPLRAFRADFTGRTQVRLECIVATGGNASSKLGIRYKTGAFSSNKADYSMLGASSTEVFTSIATGGDTLSDSGWINITAAALAEVWIIPITLDGDGAADPILKQGLVSYK